MKIVRRSNKEECELWEFIKQHVPASLVATKLDNDYGWVYGVRVREPGGVFRRGSLIAEVDMDCLTVYQPKYYTDFEDLGRKYEEQTGKSITLQYWES